MKRFYIFTVAVLFSIQTYAGEFPSKSELTLKVVQEHEQNKFDFNVTGSRQSILISYETSDGGNASIEIHNVLGKLIFKGNDLLKKGKNQLFVEPKKDLGKGIYFTRIVIGEQMLTKRTYLN